MPTAGSHPLPESSLQEQLTAPLTLEDRSDFLFIAATARHPWSRQAVLVSSTQSHKITAQTGSI